ncbi:ABC transporter ATP-binding protein [Paenibacillus sp. FJAT-26967]|uniref:ABC transporter ATP-binding protein n=1 Tax=Paenibacillus sp. FJAT-26967 TaxID=1729690 RepID=UPI0008388170|nr:ABC transporter ATP-binding protein [Paenibacillus sp. FJAT-26967]
MDEYSIRLKGISKKYKLYNKPVDRIKEILPFHSKKLHKEFYAVNNISLDVKKGETLGIIGKNGSGKSTLLKIISGVLTETAGTKEINGEISALLELGTGFNPEYSGIENIYLNGLMRGYTRNEMDGKLQQIVDFADIGSFIDQPIKTYSSGMFARLAFSVMISFKPEILIVDEALSVGDVFFQQKCNRFMKEEMQGVTKLLVTHDLSSIANMANRVIVIKNGVVVYEGDPLKGIEFYTKSIHTESFRVNNPIALNEHVRTSDSLLLNNFEKVSPDSLGGAQELVITGVSFTVDDSEYKGFISKGSKLEISMMIESKKATEELIIGYLVNDKYGNAVFGENTHSSQIITRATEPGKGYLVKLTIVWPEIQENDYFITLGLGEGYHEMNHIIQCWAHNIIQLKNITFNSVHGLFNNKIESITLEEIE